MIHPAKNPQPNGFDLATFAPSLDAKAGEALGEFLSHFEDPMCDECDSGMSESDLMDRLKEALDQRDAFRGALQKVIEAKDAISAYMEKIPDGCSAEPEFLGRLVRRETAAEDAARTLLNR